MNVGDVITTTEELAEVPFGAVVLFEDATGIAVYTKTGPREWNAVLISTFLPVTVLYLPGRVPRPERVVKAEALREARNAWADDPEMVGDSFADARNWLLDRADRIEAGEE